MVGVLEGIARVVEHWVPTAVVDVGLGFDPESRLFVPSPDDARLRQTAPVKVGSFQEVSFVAEKPPGTVRIFVVGESSVFNLQPLFPLWAQQLSQRFGRPVEILDAGGNSYGSARLVPIVRELVEYQPDVVLLYLGHNEFEEVEQLELVPPLLGTVRAASHLALFRLARDAITAWRKRELLEQHRRVLASSPDAVLAGRHQFTPDEAAARMAAFRANLTTMVELLTSRGVRVVIGTIPSNLWKPLVRMPLGELERLRERGDYAASAELARSWLVHAANRHQASELENRTLREVAGRFGTPLADVEAAVSAAEPHHVPGETLFADHCHLNDVGNQIWLRVFTEAMAGLDVGRQ
jgi:hypothetical protein